MSDEAPPTKILDATEVAARLFVYKLYETADGQPMQWSVLHGMGELAATISRAVERGWVILQEESRRPLERKVALTDEGRRLAARGDRLVRQGGRG
jgi:hypothetical protein